jgi:hypothetical protein
MAARKGCEICSLIERIENWRAGKIAFSSTEIADRLSIEITEALSVTRVK